MVLWNFDLLWKNHGTMGKNDGTMDKTILLCQKIWYYTENYWSSIKKKNKHGRLAKTKKLRFIRENPW